MILILSRNQYKTLKDVPRKKLDGRWHAGGNINTPNELGRG
jgi:hypothetical protein